MKQRVVEKLALESKLESRNGASTLSAMLLWLVHLAFALLVWICWRAKQLRRLWFNHRVSLDSLNRDKLPKHLVLVLGVDNLECFDVARLVDWSVRVGIPCVSIYDCEQSSRKEELVKRSLVKLRPDLEELIDWGRRTESKNGLTNGYKRKCRVSFLSYSDGKGTVVKLARELSRDLSSGRLNVEDVNVKLIEERLRLPFPDPDLAVICGDVCCTYGLLPWHIRTTEFFNLPRREANVGEFARLLEKYSLCEQRYGK